jgi:hypothetical protein
MKNRHVAGVVIRPKVLGAGLSLSLGYEEPEFLVDRYVGAIASEIYSRFPVPEPPEGLPESLAEALAAWVSEHTGEAQQFSEQSG